MADQEQVDGNPKLAGGLTRRRRRHVGGRTGAVAIGSAERVGAALALRKQGYDYATIGEALDPPVSRQAAHKMVASALQALVTDSAEELRSLMAGRLEDLLVGLWPFALKGDGEAIGNVLRILDRQAKLFGLDKAGKVEVSGRDGEPLKVETTIRRIERVIIDPPLIDVPALTH